MLTDFPPGHVRQSKLTMRLCSHLMEKKKLLGSTDVREKLNVLLEKNE